MHPLPRCWPRYLVIIISSVNLFRIAERESGGIVPWWMPVVIGEPVVMTAEWDLRLSTSCHCRSYDSAARGEKMLNFTFLSDSGRDIVPHNIQNRRTILVRMCKCGCFMLARISSGESFCLCSGRSRTCLYYAMKTYYGDVRGTRCNMPRNYCSDRQLVSFDTRGVFFIPVIFFCRY